MVNTSSLNKYSTKYLKLLLRFITLRLRISIHTLSETAMACWCIIVAIIIHHGILNVEIIGKHRQKLMRLDIIMEVMLPQKIILVE